MPIFMDRHDMRGMTAEDVAAAHHKDLNIALAAGGAYGVALAETAAVREAFSSMLARGDGDLDHSALVRLVESLAGLPAED